MSMIIGRKIGMTRAFTETGAGALTVVQATANSVVRVKKSTDKDGYGSVQLGAGVRKADKISKSLAGQITGLENAPQKIYEFKIDETELKKGDKADIDQFKKDDVVIVSGITKGKGYAGNIKRHGFHRGPTTHGSDHHRAPGSIGSAYPQRVFKGKKMAGHMGNVLSRCESTVFDVVKDENIILLNGSIPGPKGAWIKIQSK